MADFRAHNAIYSGLAFGRHLPTLRSGVEWANKSPSDQRPARLLQVHNRKRDVAGVGMGADGLGFSAISLDELFRGLRQTGCQTHA